MNRAMDRSGELLSELEALAERAREIEKELGRGSETSLATAGLARMAQALRRIANVGVFYADAAGNCLDVNERWCEITGRRRDEALGRAYLDALSPPDRERLCADWYPVPPGQIFRGEYTYVRPDGSEVRVESDTVAEVDSDGRPTGRNVSTLIDVTRQRQIEREHREAEAQLRARLEELEAVYESAPVGLAFVDDELRYRRINSRLAAINGRSVEEHLGERVEDVIPEVADKVVPVIRGILETGERVGSYEVSHVLPSDPDIEYTWLVSHRPVKGTDGRVRGIVTVVQDVSEMKRTQRELQEARRHLEAAQHLAGVGSWQWDAATDDFTWSNEMYRVYDLDRRFRPTWDAFYEQVHPEDRPMVRRQLDRIAETGNPDIREFRIVLDDGSLRWIRATCVAERSRDGSLERLTGTAEVIPGPGIGRRRALAGRHGQRETG